MDTSTIIGLLIGVGIPLLAGFIAYGRLSQMAETNKESIKTVKNDFDEKITSMKESFEKDIKTTKDSQDERDRRQDARQAATERKLEAHSADLSDMKVVLARVDTNLSHLVESLKKK